MTGKFIAIKSFALGNAQFGVTCHGWDNLHIMIPCRNFCSVDRQLLLFQHSTILVWSVGPAHKGYGSKCMFFHKNSPNSGPWESSFPHLHNFLHHSTGALRDNGAGGGGLVLPGGREDTDSLVVTGQTVDTGLDENETELGVLVLAVALKVLADGDSLQMRLC